MAQKDVVIEEVGVEAADDLLHCPSGTKMTALRTEPSPLPGRRG